MTVRWPWPARIAHRGAGREAPENTLAAMRTGAALGWRMVEFDAALTADGVPVLMHDETLARTTGRPGRVVDARWPSLRDADAGAWAGPRWRGEPVPRLDAVLAWLAAHGIAANVEIKPAPGDAHRAGTRIAQAVVATLATSAGAAHRAPPLLSSFSEAALAAARDAAPDLPRGLLFGARPADAIARARALGCVALHLRVDTVDADTIAAAHAAGLAVATYTVDDARRLAALEAAGLDAAITDAVTTIAPLR